MIKIGLVGESQNDTNAIKNLLQQKYSEGYSYTILLKNLPGDHLNTPKAKKAIAIEADKHAPDIIVVMRDADALESDTVAIKGRKDWFNELAGQTKKPSLFLLNIYELEALILADIASFNSHYNCTIKFKSSVTHKEKPKEYLGEVTAKNSKKYHPNHCPDLFAKMSIDAVATNCKYFKDFLSDFEEAVKN